MFWDIGEEGIESKMTKEQNRILKRELVTLKEMFFNKKIEVKKWKLYLKILRHKYPKVYDEITELGKKEIEDWFDNEV